MSTIVRLTLLLCFIAAELSAQAPVDPRAAQIRELSALPPWAMTDQRAQTLVESTVGLLLDQMWDAKEIAGVRPPQKPAIRAVVEGRRRPAYVRGKEIVFPVEYFELLTELSTVLAHDLYVSTSGELDYPNPLITHPYAASRILPLWDPLVMYLQNSYFSDAQQMLSCQQEAKCAYLQQTQFTVDLLFVLLHELTHLALQDRPGSDGSYPLQQEMTADRRAWDALQLIAAETPRTGQNRAVPLAFAAGPVLILEFEKSTKTGQAENVLMQREDALIALAPRDLASSVKRAVLPRRSSTAFSLVTISSPVNPDFLVLDGVRLSPREVLGKALLLRNGVHELVGVSGERLGHEEVVLTGGPEDVTLTFENLSPGLSSDAELRSLEEKDDWFGILLRTSGAGLQPRDRSLAYLHWKALDELNLNDWIRVDPAVPLSKSQVLDVEIWTDRKTPLKSHWRDE
ncbi:MAG TPA: hypothetical protein VG675_19580 [Bryobacteraceae bacterium]|nr:hypothetical protein [Bryobacteraceae bacterium]